MDFENIEFKNFSTNKIHDVAFEYDVFPYLTKPLFQLISNTGLQKAVDHVKGQILKDERIFPFQECPLKFYLGYPMLYPYLTLILACILILATPIILHVTFKRKPTLDGHKHPYWFIAECIFLVFTLVGLIVASAASLQSVLQFRVALTKYPGVIKNIEDELTLQVDKYEEQVRSLHEDVNFVVQRLLLQISQFPEKTLNIIEKQVDPDMNYIAGNITYIFQETQTLLNKSGLDNEEDKKPHKVELAANYFAKNLQIICTTLQDLENNVNSSNKINDSIKQMVLKQMENITRDCYVPAPDRYNFPNWDLMLEQMNKIMCDVVPRMKNVLFYKDRFFSSLVQNTRQTFLNIHNNATALEEKSDVAFCSVQKLLSRLTCKVFNSKFFKYANRIRETMKTMNFPSNYPLINISTFLMIMPVILGWLSSLVVIAGLYFLPKDMRMLQKYYSVSHYTIDIRSIAFFKTSIVIITSLLWFWILLSGIFFTSAFLLNVGCDMVKDSPQFSKYLDSIPKRNNTSLTSHWFKQSINVDIAPIKITAVLGKCYRNQPIYNAIGLEKKWDIIDSLNVTNMKIDPVHLKNKIINALEKVNLDELENQYGEISDSLQKIDNELNFDFMCKLHEDFSQVNDTQKINKLMGIVNELPRDKNYDFISDELLKVVNLFKEENTTARKWIFDNGSKLLDMKYKLLDFGPDVCRLHAIQNDFDYNIKYQLNMQFTRYAEKMAKNLSNILDKLSQHCKRNIENNMGKCYEAPLSVHRLTNVFCIHGLPLMHAMWISFGLLGFFMLFCLIMVCRIMAYTRGTEKLANDWRKRIAHKISTMSYVEFSDNKQKLSLTY